VLQIFRARVLTEFQATKAHSNLGLICKLSFMEKENVMLRNSYSNVIACENGIRYDDEKELYNRSVHSNPSFNFIAM
jgi:hypothetical protein